VGGRSSSWVVAEVGVTLSTRVIRSKSAAAADVQRRAADDELSCTHSDLIYRVIRVIAFEISASLRALAPSQRRTPFPRTHAAPKINRRQSLSHGVFQLSG